MLLTTDCVPPRERAETVRSAIWESVLRLEIDHLDPTDIQVTATITDLGCDCRISVRVPLAALNVPEDVARGLSAVTSGQDLPTDPRATAALGQSTLQLVRSLAIAQQPPGARCSARSDAVHRDITADSLEMRIMEFVRRSLTNPDLDARMIARAHGISVRYLYKVLARAGITLGEWIRGQRLELCRSALSEQPPPETAPPTIAAVAHGSGFGDLTHFARTFRKAYGVSPREYRAAASGVGR